MQVDVLQEELSKALQLATRFVNLRAQLPILANVVLSAQKTKLTILATNLEISIAISLGAKVQKEGAIAIPGKALADIVSNLSTQTITLKSKEEKLGITSENFSAVISGINAADFPELVKEIDKNAIELPKEKIKSALSQVVFSTATDEARPILTGVLFIFSKGALLLVATDGFRLSYKKIPLPAVKNEQKLILPRNFINELLRILTNENFNLKFSFQSSEKQAIFGVPKAVISTRIIEGEFPDFEKIIPRESKVSITLDKEEFLRAVRIASVFARESSNVIQLKILKNNIKVSAESSRTGSQETTLDAKVKGEELTISYNYRFIEEFLAVCPSDEIELSFSDPNSPGVFRDTKDPDFLHLIMPIRT